MGGTVEYRERVEQRIYGRAHGQISEISHTGFGYGHPVIGYRNPSSELADVSNFHRRWYVPDNAVLVVAGDADPEAVIDAVYAYFGDLSVDLRDLPDFAEPHRMLPQHTRVDDSLAGPPAVFVNHPAVPTVTLIFSSMRCSRRCCFGVRAVASSGRLLHPQVRP